MKIEPIRISSRIRQSGIQAPNSHHLKKIGRFFYPGLFTSQYCCSEEEVAREGVVNYCERATMKSMQ
jgi:hypothetical protein